ncbi:MAG: biotin transporter BioY, partial [Thermotogae bacterium]
GNFGKAFLVGVAPFVPIDLMKGAIAVVIADRVKRAVRA